MSKIPLVIINAPTATGKTSLAITLARKFGGEIVNADSMQVYRHMDIGTAKPTKEQRREAPHHLIDVVDPDEEFNAALYAETARAVIGEINERKKPVFVAGGTGLYIRALTKGIIDTPAVDERIRNHYKKLGETRGKIYLFELLKEKDPAAAFRINPNDAVRVIRALEVFDQTGESITLKQIRHAFSSTPYRTLKIGLRVAREILKARIAARTKEMIAAGFVDEVRGLLQRGYSQKLKPMQSLGYRQIIRYLAGDYDLKQAELLIARDTWHYAKRQMTWFAADKSIQWFAPDNESKIEAEVKNFLQENDLI
ncbi:MAG TPA: tRNA (adenosine(37)-N6)-dimethylallyltransferase MiaA [Smithellaceae bacterium]|nr:tRNA (adenosine(37)-N6)-dimethylallyltransferase MiaA [Smithellaceae bacterium]HRS88720.1 tRNA (adenosine(37)-N6)-dimethylallyltransferase MiaA [Smithellaceae bacterium]HRV26549.1 tRNA (adenosine(37)-N6)-dimethylallyltransferase MiaA [Smithellaceae bacterium]